MDDGVFVFGPAALAKNPTLRYTPTGLDNPKGAMPMSKYGDDYACTCEMNLVSCDNNLHATDCNLWCEPTFVSGHDEWDGDLGCLVLKRNPWSEPENYIWNGDTPVVRRETAEARTQQKEIETIGDIVAEWERMSETPTHRSAGGVEFIGTLEQEAMDALTAGSAQSDEFGMVCLPDGSFADFEVRVTYRKTMTDEGVKWEECFWDAPVEVIEADAMEPVTCTCNPPKKFYCHVCRVQRKDETCEWGPWVSGASNSPANQGYVNDGWVRCNHTFETFSLPGKQHRNIKISGKRWHTATTTPDFGLYAYGGWDPDCVATFIPWQDYGLPKCSYENAALAIKEAWERSCEGQVVEVGCMGGHGRTGTILACLAVLSDPEINPKSAVAWVRKVHCHEAIETNEQEWFVAWFKSWLTGTQCPPKPTTYVSKHSANWQAAGTAAAAVKATPAALPKASSPVSPSGGATSNGAAAVTGKWCDHCKRFVYVQHNNDCPFDYIKEFEPQDETAKVLEFATEVIAGETANARRRNAKRANRRAARRRARQEAWSD